jgi:3'(2'), 5'-bisphosphate nucleotidase
MLDKLLELTRSVGWGAAEILRDYYRGNHDLEIQKADSDPVTAADLAVNHYILERMQAELEGEQFGFLSEETFKPGPPFPQPYVWIIDPLDGTKDFIQKTGEFVIHIALVEAGRPILSVVACPEAQKLYYATKGGGAFMETIDGKVTQLQVSQRRQPEDMRLVVSRSHRDDRFDKVISSLPQKQKKYVGSVGGKIGAIVEQEAEIYLSLTTKSAPKDWDLAAPELILTEAGGQFTHFDLTPIEYNRGDVAQWGGFLATNGEVHAELCQQVQHLLTEIDSQA